jgi:hypothetical protein
MTESSVCTLNKIVKNCEATEKDTLHPMWTFLQAVKNIETLTAE